MEIQAHIKEMKEIYNKLHKYICNEVNSESQLKDLIKLLKDSLKKDNSNKLREIIHIINDISDNHHRIPNFFDKIEQILLHLKDDIKKSLSNLNIFNIVKENKRLLLWFIEQKIVIVDKSISIELFQLGYYDYLNFEIQSGFNSKIDHTKDHEYQEFEQKRRKGENESLICQLIRDDSLEEFISFVEKNNICLTGQIKRSIFETNKLFKDLWCEQNIIQYAAYHGSIKIIKYLISKGVSLDLETYLFAIHSNNIEILKLFESKKDELSKEEDDLIVSSCFSKYNDKEIYESLLIEAIQCHHNDMVNFIMSNYLKDKVINRLFLSYVLESYNYEFFPDNFIGFDNEKIFSIFCKKDYVFYSNYLLKNANAEICQIALCQSVSEGNVEIVRLLLTRQDIDVNFSYETILILVLMKMFYLTLFHEISFNL